MPDIENTNDTAQQEKTFTQSEVDTMIQNRIARERKKYPTDDEMTAYRNWKSSQQTEQERMNDLIKERDTSKQALTAAQAQIEEMRRSNYVLSKGLSGDEAEFITFKAAKMVDDNTTFEKAVDNLIKEQSRKVKVDFSAQVGAGKTGKEKNNAMMNDLIRNAFK